MRKPRRPDPEGPAEQTAAAPIAARVILCRQLMGWWAAGKPRDAMRPARIHIADTCLSTSRRGGSFLPMTSTRELDTAAALAAVGRSVASVERVPLPAACARML